MNRARVNLSTVKYTICEKGFKYHILKGKFIKGSTIAKKKHPNKYVELVKKDLIKNNKLIDRGEFYELKENIKIGAMMAYNLHYGFLKTEFDNANDIVINSNQPELKSEFDFKNINSTDSIFHRSLLKNSLKLEKIYQYKIRKEFLKGNHADEFSETEKLVFDILKKENEIIKGQHGKTDKNEADIIDETLGKQIEVVIAFKTAIKDKLRQKYDTFYFTEFVDSNLIHISEAVKKKFNEKKYTNNLKKELAIFCFGNSNTSIGFLEKLKEFLEKNPNTKNNFTQIHFIIYDFIKNCVCYMYKNGIKYYKDSDFKDLNIDFIDKKKIKLEDVQDEVEYIFLNKNIFKKEEYIVILKGKDFKNYARDMMIIVE